MTFSRFAKLRARWALSLALMAIGGVAACSTAQPTLSPQPRPSAATTTAPPTATPQPTPSASPPPTPRFTNEPDQELAGLIPDSVAGVPVVVAAFEDFGLTPGDVGTAYGEIGDRFESLALAYVELPRTTLYAVRVSGEPVDTDELEPHLATAGRYVGIAGLDADPWETATIGGNRVWMRPEDNATVAGTHVYTWSAGEFIFLLIGVDDAVNQALVATLPGQPAPTPSPTPSPGASVSGSGSPGPSDLDGVP